MNEDFKLFLINLLLSLKQTAPLNENLGAVMAPMLERLKRYTNARVAAHAFVNAPLNELHVMTIGSGARTTDVLRRERMYRHKPVGNRGEPTHRKDLPVYKRFDITPETNFINLLETSVDIRAETVSEQVANLFRALQAKDNEELSELDGAQEGDQIILIPLQRGDYWRLGFFLLWTPDGSLTSLLDSSTKQEGLIAFRKDVEGLLIRLFENFYQMAPNTYLPSYYQVERKPVALLCAEIRGFDRISQILRQRNDLGPEWSADCLRKLVNRFSETVARIIEQYGDGRVDQVWGNGLLAVFGQYPNMDNPQPSVPCMYAVKAAREIVEKARQIFERWLCDDFLFQRYETVYSEHIELEAVVAVDYGDAVFDYFGSTKKKVYMTVGDHVNFVKQLVSMAGQKEFDINDYDTLLRHFKLIREPALGNNQQYSVPPILLSRSAFTGAFPALQFRPGDPANWEYQHRIIRLPGKQAPYSTYELWPENVIQQAR